MATLTVSDIQVRNSGKKISYEYNVSKDIEKLFNEPFWIEYNIDVNRVPESILIIPLLANILPISWIYGFDIVIDTLDRQFFNAILKIKEVFSIEFPQIKSKKSNIIYRSLTDNEYICNKNSLLFSGGVDAYASYFNHYNENFDLALIQGADIPLSDDKQWKSAKQKILSDSILSKNSKKFIKMNCRDFYTPKVNELIRDGSWWGKVQHGLSLCCAIAPLSYIEGYQNLYIAATHTPNFQGFWGSMPEIDNNIRWANTQVIHDAYHMERIDKVKLIIDSSKTLEKKPELRVCYSELNNGLNCNMCEKCYRTIFALMLFNANPNQFGFNVNKNFYINIEKIWAKGFQTEGIRYNWGTLLESLKSNNLYQIDGYEYDKSRLKHKLNIAVTSRINSKDTPVKLIKRKIINTFPNTFQVYLKFRRLLK